jgi:hypothetical protein
MMTLQNRITVLSSVTSIITQNQPIYACIKQKLINYHALAAKTKPEVKRIPGLASLLTDLLYRSGINIINTYISEETILILDRIDGPRAYEILEREIVRSKQGP